MSSLPPTIFAGLAFRLPVAGALLLSEYLIISFRFDSSQVQTRGGSWLLWGHLGSLGPLLIVGCAAALLWGRNSWTQAFAQKDWGPLRPVLLVSHLFGYAALYFITDRMFAREQAPPGPAWLWFLAWLASSSFTFASLFGGLVKDGRRLVRLLLRPSLLGLAIGTLAWLGGNLSSKLWDHLAGPTFHGVRYVLRALGVRPAIDASRRILELEGFAIEVSPVCSGFEGIGLFWVLMGLFLVQQRRSFRFPAAFLLLPIGTAGIWAGNTVRIAGLLLLGARYDPDVAIGSFHSKAGWVFFSAVTILVAWGALRSRFFSHEATTAACNNKERPFLGLTPIGAKARPRKSLRLTCLACVVCYRLLGHASASPSKSKTSPSSPLDPVITRSEDEGPPSAAAASTQSPLVPVLLPLLTWIGVSLLSSSLSDGHDPFYGLRVIVTAGVLWSQRTYYLARLRLPSGLAVSTGAAVGALWLLVVSLGDSSSPPAPPVLSWSWSLSGWLFVRTLGAVAIIPLVEELAFRYFLTRWVSERDFESISLRNLSWIGILVSSIVFSLVHEQHLLALATGVIYCWLLRKRGELSDAVAAHAASNLVIALWVLATLDFRHW